MTERAKMKGFTNFAVPRSFLPELQFCFFPTWKNVSGPHSERFSEIIGNRKHPENTLKRRFLSKKGPKEGERVARGHFHERVGETPVHWLPPGVGITPKPFFVSENGPFENFLRSNSIFI